MSGRAYAALATEWSFRARAHGIDRLDRPRRVEPAASRVDEHRFSAAVWLTPHGGVRRRDAVVAFAGAAPDGIVVGDLDRLVDQWVPPGPVGVAEPLHPRRLVVPGGHLLRALGPRPLQPDAHEAWVGAARAVEAYRLRWGLGASVEPLGASGSLASAPHERLVDHLRVTHQVEAVRARLVRHEPRDLTELARGRAR
jgi:hypothetical protein